MRVSKYIIAAALVTTLNIGIGLALPTLSSAPRAATAESTSCPANTPQGAYNQLGTDDNGNAICHFVYSNACPYTEAVSADDPLCYKNQPAAAQPVTTTPAAVPTGPVNQCGGTQ